MSNKKWAVVLVFMGLGLTVLMYRVMLGCRFGYDATVLLVIAEDWGRGLLPFHAYIESKPLGMYVVDRLLLWVCGKSPYGLYASALGINLVLCLVPTIGFRKYLRPTERIVTAVAMLAVGFLTEMQYLITEQPTAIFGALGFIVAFGSLERRHRVGGRALAAGLSLGISFMFKPVAAFYLVALTVVVAMERYHFRKSRLGWLSGWFVDMVAATMGFFIPFGVACLWALRHGVLQEMLLESLWNPFMCYQAHHLFLGHFLLKMSPLLAAWGIALVIFARNWARNWARGGFDDERIRWQTGLLVFALVSSVALLKNQASHYFITALPFVVPFIVSAIGTRIERVNPRYLRALGAGAAIMAVGLVASHWGALKERLGNPLEEDRRFARALVAETREGEFALLINGLERTPANVYWFTGLRPPWPYLSIDQPSYCFLDRNKGLLLSAIHNPQTAIVAWIPEDPVFYLARTMPFPSDEVEQAIRVLHEEYEPVPQLEGKPVRGLWRRKGRSAQERPFPGGPFTGT